VIVFKAIQKASDALDNVCTVITVILLGAMTLVTLAQVVFRIFFTAIIWSEEVTRYMLVWLTFIGAGCVHKRAKHIAITLLQKLFPDNIRKSLEILTQLLCIAVFIVAIYFGFLYMNLMGAQLSPSLRVPMRYMYAAIPVGGSILLLHSVSWIIQICTQKEGDTK